MGNCCCPELDEHQTTSSSSNNVFQGEGHRLGSSQEAARLAMAPGSNSMARDEEVTPEPAYNPNLTDEQRAKIRADRAAAAEARLKKQTGGKKSKKTSAPPPLRGPNSQPLMRWNAG